MTENILRLSNITKSFGDTQVLRGISLDIEKGEFITFLGSSGCGKTTTLRIIAGLESPDSGSVILGGQDVTTAQPNHRDVNTIFQNYALFPHMNVYNNIAYSLRLRKVDPTEIRRRVTEMLELAIDCIELGSIPNTNDQTIAGSADRIRMDSPKAVFAVGVNEGVFPAKYSPYGVFSDQERERLIESGIELSASRFQRALLERFFLYSTLCGAGERLYISYSAATLSGGQQEPSLIVGQLSGMFPGALTDAAAQPADFYVADLFTAREQYVRRLGAGLPAPELAEAIAEEGDSSFITLMHSLAEGAPAQGIQRPTAKALINGKLNLSPTKIESFFR